MSRQIHIPNFKSISQKTAEKSLENWISAKGNNSYKRRLNVTKLKLDLYYVMTNSYTKFQVNISKDDWEKFGKPSGRTPSGLTDGRTDGQTDGQTDRQNDRRGENLKSRIMSRQIHIPNFKSISQKTAEKSLENWISAKGNNSYKRTNSYTKFQVNISKDDWEKFGKPSGRTPSGLTDGLTDRQTEWQTGRKPKVPPVSPVGD